MTIASVFYNQLWQPTLVKTICDALFWWQLTPTSTFNGQSRQSPKWPTLVTNSSDHSSNQLQRRPLMILQFQQWPPPMTPFDSQLWQSHLMTTYMTNFDKSLRRPIPLIPLLINFSEDHLRRLILPTTFSSNVSIIVWAWVS